MTALAITVSAKPSVSVSAPMAFVALGAGVPVGFVGAALPRVIVMVSTLLLPSVLVATTVISKLSLTLPRLMPLATVTSPVTLSITKRPLASSLKL